MSRPEDPRHPVQAAVPPGAVLSVQITASEAELLYHQRLLLVRERDLLGALAQALARSIIHERALQVRTEPPRDLIRQRYVRATFGEKLRAAAASQNLTSRMLAYRAGLRIERIHELLSGAGEAPSDDEQAALREALPDLKTTKGEPNE